MTILCPHCTKPLTALRIIDHIMEIHPDKHNFGTGSIQDTLNLRYQEQKARKVQEQKSSRDFVKTGTTSGSGVGIQPFRPPIPALIPTEKTGIRVQTPAQQLPIPFTFSQQLEHQMSKNQSFPVKTINLNPESKASTFFLLKIIESFFKLQVLIVFVLKK